MTAPTAPRAPALKVFIRFGLAGLFALAVTAAADAGAGLSARDVASLLFKAAPGSHPALNGRDLTRLDLAGLDFKKADLSKSDFFGADLSGANLSGTDLSGASLDRVTLIGARLDGARLDHASMMRPSTFSTIVPLLSEASSFKGASLKSVRFFGTFVGADFSGADLTDAYCAPNSKTGFIEHIWRTDFMSANLSNSPLTRADIALARLSFANLKGAVMRDVILLDADLSGTDMTGADMTGADLSGADLTDADVTGADLAGVKLTGAKGLDTLKGLALAHNSAKVVR